MMNSFKTYSAIDAGYMGDLSAPNLKFDDLSVSPKGTPYAKNQDIANRCKQLLRWGCYYTACAIMWVLDRCNTNIDGDTTSDRFFPSTKPCEAPSRKPALSPHINEAYLATKRQESRDFAISEAESIEAGASALDYSQLGAFLLSTIAPLAGVIGVPVVYNALRDLKSKGEVAA